ncbi:peptidoglycan-binding protein, partial [bacterium]|nr:peptidoglycan-binding protein [bacterium]
RNLSLGTKGEDVRQLQIFLNSQGFTVSTKGMGSKGLESTTFGPATKSALIRYQVANNIKPASGLFGPLTMKKVTGK